MTYLDKMDIALVEVIKEYLKSLGVDIFELEEIDITGCKFKRLSFLFQKPLYITKKKASR